MAGGCAASGFAAELIHLRYKDAGKPVFPGHGYEAGLKKPFFQANSPER